MRNVFSSYFARYDGNINVSVFGEEQRSGLKVTFRNSGGCPFRFLHQTLTCGNFGEVRKVFEEHHLHMEYHKLHKTLIFGYKPIILKVRELLH